MAHVSRGGFCAVFISALAVLCLPSAHATVKSFQKISDTAGGFTAPLDDDDRFGISIAPLGDLDSDGVDDIAVGAYFDDFYGNRYGAVYVLFLNVSGTVKSHVKIGDGLGGFTGDLDFWDEFGISVTTIGDLDDDGVVDIAVGARGDDDSAAGPNLGTDRGALWILFLNSNGTVKSHQKISDYSGGLTGQLQDTDLFGNKAATVGDLDGDNVEDLAVSASGANDGGIDRGAVRLLYLNTDGTVKDHRKISSTSGGFTGALDDGDLFGAGVASLGDLDGDGVLDLAVGATFDDDGGADRGAVWILFMNSNGTVKTHQKISDTQGGFTGVLDNNDRFGVTALLGTGCAGGKVLAVGATMDDDGGSDYGAVWLLRLNTDGTVSSHSKISATAGGFTGDLDFGDLFGLGVESLGDFDGDGVTDLAVGARLDDDGGENHGAVWILFLDECSIQPQTVNFGNVTVNQVADASFSVKNTGCDPISGDITESCGPYSILAGGGPFTLAGGDSIVVSVRFAPTATGTFNCALTTGNSGCGNVSLTGVGVAPPVNPNPDITSIADIGNDQGRVVRITFARSGRDVINSPTPILQYEIFRRIDDLPSVIAHASAASTKLPTAMISDRGTLLAGWDYVMSLPAHGESVYNVLAPTLADSTKHDGIHWSVFFVRAATAQPLVFFDSPPDSGYSIDNTKPGPPNNLSIAFQAGQGNTLTWTAPTDPDVVQYYVYRSTEPGFEPSDESFLSAVVETELVDPAINAWQYHYLVSAVDFSGNESNPAAGSMPPTAIGDRIPSRSALHQNVPNPFNPSTTISYDIAAPGGQVTLEIFDVRGQLVRTLVDKERGPGVWSENWDGRDHGGRRVASGVYFYRLKVGRETFTRKMAIVQ